MKSKEQIIEKKLDNYLVELERTTWKTKSITFVSFKILCKNAYGVLIKVNEVDVDGKDITRRDFTTPFNLLHIKRGSSFRLNNKVIVQSNENIVHMIKQLISYKLSYFSVERCVRKKRAK